MNDIELIFFELLLIAAPFIIRYLVIEEVTNIKTAKFVTSLLLLFLLGEMVVSFSIVMGFMDVTLAIRSLLIGYEVWNTLLSTALLGMYGLFLLETLPNLDNQIKEKEKPL
ncbi:hypothetical protein [Vibrio europaeus]|uniref:hypothetical protein n=1 Tax=Vibrio europaeus TaxID=300876 RepID=UPI0039E0EB4E